MMLSLSDEHKSHLSLLFDQPPQLLQDFCRLGLDLLSKGHNSKLYHAAAQKLQVEVQVIQLAVEAIVHLIARGQQYNLSESDFRDIALATGFSELQEAILSEFYVSSREHVHAALSTLTPSLVHYHDLEWRFDVQVASRSLSRQTIPSLTMKLTLLQECQNAENGKLNSILVQTDPNNLKHLINKLDEALADASSQHSRRLQRILK